jgi:hypothetical protein
MESSESSGPPHFKAGGNGGECMSDDSDGNLIQIVNRWWMHPFSAGGSAFNWVLFVGLVVIAAFLWQLVLIQITKEV